MGWRTELDNVATGAADAASVAMDEELTESGRRKLTAREKRQFWEDVHKLARKRVYRLFVPKTHMDM